MNIYEDDGENTRISPSSFYIFQEEKRLFYMCVCAMIIAPRKTFCFHIIRKGGFMPFGKNAPPLLIFADRRFCVAAIGALRFSARGFGCALFIFPKNAW